MSSSMFVSADDTTVGVGGGGGLREAPLYHWVMVTVQGAQLASPDSTCKEG